MNNKLFKKSTKGRDFVVGDLHGCYDEFMSQLNGVDFNYSIDRMFSVGDLIDRGKDSMKCLELTREKWFHAVRGNHEQMLIDGYYKGGDHSVIHRFNGGEWFYQLDA